MIDDEPHRSRTGWPGPLSVAGVGEGHTHDLPRPLLKRVRLLTQALIIVGGCLVTVATLLLLIISQRGEQRDRENDRLRDEIRQGHCDLLSQLPASPLLDDVRSKYGCGPGRPVEDFPPEVRDQLAGRTQALPPGRTAQQPPARTAPPPDPMDGAGVDAPQPAPEPPPEPSPQPPPTSEPPPRVLDPITDPLCDDFRICLP